MHVVFVFLVMRKTLYHHRKYDFFVESSKEERPVKIFSPIAHIL